MRTIIAGTRTITDVEAVRHAVANSGFQITEVLCGMCPGPDLNGKLWADLNKIPVKKFPANWFQFGKKAGPMRNKLMAEHADALIAIWDGKSSGTRHMIKVAKEKGLKVFVFNATIYEETQLPAENRITPV